MNRFISNAIRYAMEGDSSTYTNSYPQWVLNNQVQLNQWLENPHIDEDVKKEIREANRKAMSQLEPQPQTQTPSNTDELTNLLKSAKNMKEFINIIEQYPNDMFASNGSVLDKDIMLQKIREYSNDPVMLGFLADSYTHPSFFRGTHITSNYEMRETFRQLAKIEYQNKVVFPQALKSANSLEEFINIIKNHPYALESADGRELDKTVMLAKMQELSTDSLLVEHIVNNKASTFVFAGTNITSQYGMRDKFIELVEKQYNADINNKYAHLKSEVVTQIGDMFSHFGTHYNIHEGNGVNFTFSRLYLSNDNRKVFESVLQKANIPFDVNDYSLTISIPPAQFASVIAALKESANEIKNSQMRLQQKIDMATSLPEIIKVIKEHDGMMLSKTGAYLDKQAQLKAIENLQNPNPHFTGSKVTSNYGLESKVNKLVQQQRASNRPLPQTPQAPQPAPQAQRPPQHPPQPPLKPEVQTPQASQPAPQAQRPPQQPPQPPLKPEAQTPQAPQPAPQQAQRPPQQPPQSPLKPPAQMPPNLSELINQEIKTVLEPASKLSTIFSVDKNTLMKEYQAIRAGHGFSGWINAQVKDVGKALSHRGKHREQQIENLASAFNVINTDAKMNTTDKALNMYAYLSKLVLDVSLESATFKQMSPAIIKLCEKYMKDIEGVVGKDKIQELNNNVPNLEERVKLVKQKTTINADPERTKRNSNRHT